MKKAPRLNKKVVIGYQSLAGDFCVHGRQRILQSLMPNKHPAFSVLCLHQCYHNFMLDAKGVQNFHLFVDSYIAMASKLQALCLQPCASLYVGIA